MVQINTELMLQRRIQLGWTSEELAERSGLDARTIRRLEQGKTRARLHTAVAVAQALTLDTSAFVLNEVNEGSSTGERDAEEDSLAAAFRAAESTFQTELTCDGDQSFKEVMYVSSLLLTRALATEGKGLANQEEGVYEVVAAFKAADVAIRKTLSGGGDLGMEQATSVLSLLLTRFGMAFSRRPGNSLMTGFSMIEAASDQARMALSNYVRPRYPHLGETTFGEQIAEMEPIPFMESWKAKQDKWIREEMLPRWPTGTLQPDPYSGRMVAQEERSDKDRNEPKVEKSKDEP